MAARSAGLLLFAVRNPGSGDGETLQVMLGHPGGPYFVKKEYEIWSVPKGLAEPGEDLFATARREFREETGLMPPPDSATYIDLGEVRYRSGKTLRVWAYLGDCEPEDLTSNTFPLEWPPRSGQFVDVPELDRFGWFDLPEAERRILAPQRPLIDRLREARRG